jgi:Tol biopolymer transport system component
MLRKRISLPIGLTIILLACVACTFIIPGGSGLSSADMASTAVAATINALTPSVGTTPEAHSAASVTLPPLAPAASPIRVSFVSTARNLYVWSDGTSAPVQLTTSGDVVKSVVSPDGSLIAFTRSADYSNFQVDVINADGTNQHTVISTAQIAALPRPVGSLGLMPNKLAWIPGSHKLALNFRILFEGPGFQTADSLYTFDMDTNSFSTLLTASETWDFFFSPDATKLLISRPEGIDLYSSSGSLIMANVITHAFVNTASEYAWTAAPVWKPDSSVFTVSVAPAEPWGDTPGPTIVYGVTNSGTVTSSFSSVMRFGQGIASFSPDLTRMAYLTQVGAAADNNWALHIANIDGTNDSIVTTGNITNLPVWAPDGSHYIFATMTGSTSQTYLVASGAAPVLLSEIQNLGDVRWIDNMRFVISSKSGGTTSLLLGTVGSGFGVIFNDPGPEGSQQFSFDVNR